MIRKDWCGAYYLQNEYVEYDNKGNPVKTTVKAETLKVIREFLEKE